MRDLFIVSLCCGVLLAPARALASDYVEAPTLDQIVDAGIGGRVEWFERDMEVDAVHQHVTVAWAPALPPITSQNAAHLPRRTWGRAVDHPADPGRMPSAPLARRPYLLGLGTSGSSLSMPKPGNDTVTAVGRFVDTGEQVAVPVSLTSDPFGYRDPRELSDEMIARLDMALGAPREHRLNPFRVAMSWPLIWWPHLLAILTVGAYLVLMRRFRARDRDTTPWNQSLGNRTR